MASNSESDGSRKGSTDSRKASHDSRNSLMTRKSSAHSVRSRKSSRDSASSTRVHRTSSTGVRRGSDAVPSRVGCVGVATLVLFPPNPQTCHRKVKVKSGAPSRSDTHSCRSLSRHAPPYLCRGMRVSLLFLLPSWPFTEAFVHPPNGPASRILTPPRMSSRAAPRLRRPSRRAGCGAASRCPRAPCRKCGRKAPTRPPSAQTAAVR